MNEPAVALHFNPPAAGCAQVALDSSQLGNGDLQPQEASLLPGNAVEKRKREFALGRAAAHRALAQLGLSDSPPVLRGAGREPLWPEGIVGSITHCGSYAIAAVAKRENMKALGIDLEDVERVPHEDIAYLVSNEMERHWVFGDGDSQLRLAMLFSAKESIFKAFYPLEHRFFDFHAVELRWLSERRLFLGRPLIPLSTEVREGSSIEVGCQLEANFVFTHAVLASGEAKR